MSRSASEVPEQRAGARSKGKKLEQEAKRLSLSLSQSEPEQ